jgi:hypothetical protein
MSPQSYYIGGKILASDFNVFIGNINDIVGIGTGDSGYGQDYLVMEELSQTQKIRASHWNALLNAIHVVAEHQGSTISVPASTNDTLFPAANKVIQIIPTLTADIATVVANKLNYNLSQMSIETNKISSSKTYVSPSSGIPNWVGTVYYEFSTNFNNDNHRRHFFNTGGEIRIVCDLAPSGVDQQSLDWESLLNSIATIKLNVNNTVSSASVGTPGVGFNSLTNTYQKVYTKGGMGSYYSSNQLNIYAKLNANHGVTVKVSFDDVYTPDSGTGWVGSDYVAGVLTVQVDQQRADGAVVIPSPTYSHISEL